MTTLNNGLSTSEVAQKVRETRHAAAISEFNTKVSFCSQSQTEARRRIEYLRDMKAAEDQSIGNGVNMIKPTKTGPGQNSGKGFKISRLFLGDGSQ